MLVYDLSHHLVLEGLSTVESQDSFFDESFLRKLERLAILSRQVKRGQQQGERRSPKRGQSVEFADFRPYVAGDDFRRIDWNAYARLEKFFIKLFIEEEDLLVHMLIDTSSSMNWGDPNKFWYALRAAAALGFVVLAGLDRLTVTALGSGSGQAASDPGLYFPPHRGKQQAMSLFSFLQTLTTNGRTDLAPRLRAYATRITQPGPLLLFSDLLDPGWADGLQALAARGFEVTILHILAPDEANPDLDGDLKLRDCETSTELEITADDDLLYRYRQGLLAWQEELHRFCGMRSMHYVPLETSLPFEELLFNLLQRQGVLK